MNKPVLPNLTKTCVNCGQQKPLSAFLEMSSSHGASYGNVCAACRKTVQERRKKTDAEGSTTSETGHKIDSKTKIHEAVGKREKFQQTEEDYHKERDLNEAKSEEIIEKKQITEHREKKHRQDFLHKPIKVDSKKLAAAIAAGKAHSAEIITRTAQQQEAAAQQTHGAKEEQKKTQHDFSVPYQGQQVAGQIRFQGQIFQQFRQWLGNSAPIVNNVNVTIKETATKQTGAIAQSANQIQDTAAAHDKGEVKKDSIRKDPATDFIEENFRPGSKR